MPTRFLRPIFRTDAWRVLALLFAILGSWAAAAEADCRLDQPRFVGEGTEARVVVSLDCVEGAQSGYARYPDGPLYVGMSIFALPDTVGEASAVAMGEEYNVEAVEIASVNNDAEAVLLIGPLDPALTHYVIAVWAEVTECAFIAADRCFGPFDDLLYPVPVDTWPQPVCDRQALRDIGYFDYTSDPGVDPSGFQAPAAVQEAFYSADCFREAQSDFGLGLSLKSWRLAPLPGHPS